MIQATIFHRPDGRQEIIDLTNVYSKDANYINDNDINVSLEQTPFGIAVYFDDGTTLDDGTPEEIIIFEKGRSCEDCIEEGVKLLKERKTNET